MVLLGVASRPVRAPTSAPHAEQVLPSIAIIGGTGALGGALAARFAAMGREVWIGSRDPAKAAGAAAGLTGATGTGLAEAAAQAELCILTVPYAAHGETLRQIREAVQGKIL